MKPPKCKSCGKEEWRHTCGGGVTITASSSGLTPRKNAPKLSVASELLADRVGSKPSPTNAKDAEAGILATLARGTKPSRKEYLKLKARERRARQKAARG